MLESLMLTLKQLFGSFIFLGLPILLPYATSYWMLSAFIRNKKYVKTLAIIVTITSFGLLTLPYFLMVCNSSLFWLINAVWLPLCFFILGLLPRIPKLKAFIYKVKSEYAKNNKEQNYSKE